MLARIDHLEAQIGDIVETDPFGPGADPWATAVAELRASIPTLRAKIEDEIAP
jgi:hypothetical protein